MKQLVATSNLSLVESLRLSLEAEGITVAVNNVAMAPLQPITVWVRDEDFAEARRIAGTLQSVGSPVRIEPAPRRPLRLVVLFTALLLGWLCVTLW